MATIKPLDWRKRIFNRASPDYDDIEDMFEAVGVSLATFRRVATIDVYREGKSRFLLSAGKSSGYYATLEAAQAAAQFDYEKVIRAVIAEDTNHEALWDALSWIRDQDPRIVDDTEKKFSIDVSTRTHGTIKP